MRTRHPQASPQGDPGAGRSGRSRPGRPPGPGNLALAAAVAGKSPDVASMISTGKLSGSSLRLLQRDGYDDEISNWNSTHKTTDQITSSEESTYKKLRQSGFAPPGKVKPGKRTEPGEGEITLTKVGADFVAMSGDRLWIVEVKGTNVKWVTGESVDVNTASGSHKPAKQIAASVKAKEAGIVKALKEPLGKRFGSGNLLLAVTSLKDADAMMAIVVREDAKWGDGIAAQHPVTLTDVISFVESKIGNAEAIADAAFDVGVEAPTSTRSPTALGRINNQVMQESESEELFGKALEGGISDWTKPGKDERAVQALDYLEIAYNLARETNDHPLSGENPLATQSLVKIAAAEDRDGVQYRVALQPVLSGLP